MPGQHRRKGKSYYTNWIFRMNRSLLASYLDSIWEPIEHESIKRAFKKDPYIGYVVLNDYARNLKDPQINWKKMLSIIDQPGCEIVLISGSKREGKTYLGWQILEEMYKKGHDVYWVGPPVNLPDWCKYAADISELPAGAFGLVDEAAVFLNNRKAMTKKNIGLLDHIPTMAHAGVTCIFITQSTARTDTALTGWADIHFKKKYSNVYGQSTERNVVVDDFDYYFNPPDKTWSYIKSGSLTGLIQGPHLPWYDDNFSKPFSLIDNQEMAHQYAETLGEAGYDAPDIQHNMKLRGWKMPVMYWNKYVVKDEY